MLDIVVPVDRLASMGFALLLVDLRSRPFQGELDGREDHGDRYAKRAGYPDCSQHADGFHALLVYLAGRDIGN